MLAAANNLEFEKAALLRDQVRELKRAMSGEPAPKPGVSRNASYGKSRGRKFSKGRSTTR